MGSLRRGDPPKRKKKNTKKNKKKLKAQKKKLFVMMGKSISSHLVPGHSQPGYKATVAAVITTGI